MSNDVETLRGALGFLGGRAVMVPGAPRWHRDGGIALDNLLAALAKAEQRVSQLALDAATFETRALAAEARERELRESEQTAWATVGLAVSFIPADQIAEFTRARRTCSKATPAQHQDADSEASDRPPTISE